MAIGSTRIDNTNFPSTLWDTSLFFKLLLNALIVDRKEKKNIYIYTRERKHDENWPRYHWEPTLCWSYTCMFSVHCCQYAVYILYYTIYDSEIRQIPPAAVSAGEKDLKENLKKPLRIVNELSEIDPSRSFLAGIVNGQWFSPIVMFFPPFFPKMLLVQY